MANSVWGILKRMGLTRTKGKKMNGEFQAYRLTECGKDRAQQIAEIFNGCLEQLRSLCPEGRDFVIARTLLEEACFFATKAMAKYPVNHEPSEEKNSLLL
jgi:hypothetical protein